MKGAGEIKLFGNKYQLPSFVPPEPPEPKKIRKSKKAKNVTALPDTNSTGNAGISNSDNGLDAERYRVTDAEQSCETPQNSVRTPEPQNISNTDNAVTQETQLLDSKNIPALPVENGAGNAGNVARDRLFALRKRVARNLAHLRANEEGDDPAPTHRKRVRI
jgi:hypothetical protein